MPESDAGIRVRIPAACSNVTPLSLPAPLPGTRALD